jgi:hypothetical protein
MTEETFVEVYEVDLQFCYVHVLIVVLPCRFKDLYGIYRISKKGVTRFKIIVEKESAGGIPQQSFLNLEDNNNVNDLIQTSKHSLAYMKLRWAYGSKCP